LRYRSPAKLMGNACLWDKALRERPPPMARKLLRFGCHARYGIRYMQPAGGRRSRSHVRSRGFIEVPAWPLAAIVVPVVVKPY
jgi:hypothetical protein